GLGVLLAQHFVLARREALAPLRVGEHELLADRRRRRADRRRDAAGLLVGRRAGRVRGRGRLRVVGPGVAGGAGGQQEQGRAQPSEAHVLLYAVGRRSVSRLSCAPVREWANWSGLFRTTPRTWATPGSEDELVTLVRRTRDARGRLKAVGASHSWSD